MTAPGRPAISARELDNSLRLSFQGLHALHEVGIAERTARLEEVAHLEQQLVDSGVFGGEPVQARSELQIALEIDRTLPSGLGKDEIRNGGSAHGVSISAMASAKNAGASPPSGSVSLARLPRSSCSRHASWAATLIPWP